MFLRLKPLTDGGEWFESIQQSINRQQSGTPTIEKRSEESILVKAPAKSQTALSQRGQPTDKDNMFTFSKVFGEEVRQTLSILHSERDLFHVVQIA